MQRPGKNPKKHGFQRKDETIRLWQDYHDIGIMLPDYKGNEPDLLAARKMLNQGITQPNHTIIDIGAGAGKITSGLTDRRVRVLSVEPTHVPFEEHSVQHSRIRASGLALPFANASADKILVSYVLSYIDKKKATQEIRRVLKKGGKAVILLHKPKSLHMKGIAATSTYYDKMAELVRNIEREKFVRPPEIVGFANRWNLGGQNPHMKRILTNFIKSFQDIQARGPRRQSALQELGAIRNKLERSRAIIRKLAAEKNLFKSEENIRSFFNRHGLKPIKIETTQDKQGEYGYAVLLEK
ncbi:MAG: class I SAM-dependent methyltransferase [Candidatus Diapherotrites archaeon]|uniref:Class I SAM-dependent methyltransferase n=1 Tax=Candidatus Iainarchaeum sp. TaxID=3101447 RepID=A0A7J4IXL0_9ARCH|nr:MAG: hypothetical protein QT03_C0001G0219 [archaeon GW2011_AR10]MBS3059200.1 class I SAM-dependent methyltransferase [Candidatus Diapherotrites archaeon]HIH08985.1 class I SAM-dependent methyltransferase [Candidatus Diapherotrites archaeon]